MKAIFLVCVFFVVFQGSANATNQKLVGAITLKNADIVSMVINIDTISTNCEADKLALMTQQLQYVSIEANGNTPNPAVNKNSSSYSHLTCLPLAQ